VTVAPEHRSNGGDCPLEFRCGGRADIYGSAPLRSCKQDNSTPSLRSPSSVVCH